MRSSSIYTTHLYILRKATNRSLLNWLYPILKQWDLESLVHGLFEILKMPNVLINMEVYMP